MFSLNCVLVSKLLKQRLKLQVLLVILLIIFFEFLAVHLESLQLNKRKSYFSFEVLHAFLHELAPLFVEYFFGGRRIRLPCSSLLSKRFVFLLKTLYFCSSVIIGMIELVVVLLSDSTSTQKM